MAKRFDFGGVNLNAGEEDESARPREAAPFLMLILGDFSGRGNRGICDAASIANRRALEIDRDNFDQVLSRLGVKLKLPVGDSGSIHLQFSELEDFHPDHLFEGVGAFEMLRSFRSKVADPSTFEQAARELGIARPNAAADQARPEIVGAKVAAPSPVQIASENLLDSMIQETESRVSELQRSPDPVQDFARRLAAQHSQNAPDPRQPQVLSVLDHAVGGLMRAILHNRDFQELESVWRATFYLVRQLETHARLKVYVLDVSKEELAADLNSATDLHGTGIYRALVESTVETPGADPWAVIAGCYVFDERNENATLLARIAQIAERARAPFIAEASPGLLGCASLHSASSARDWRGVPGWWSELRRRSDAGHLGFALPRFLLRLPYGKKTSSLESFDFEEFLDAPTDEDYLWGNPVFAIALLLGQSFSKSGWRMRPGMLAEIGHLPLHIETDDGEAQAKPCGEVLLTEETVEAMIEAGFMPLVSIKNRDSVRVGRFQSISDPARPLAGPWLS